jgi:type IV secretory pathway ATPase VirB11/archaellum biosynthesis ATPase
MSTASSGDGRAAAYKTRFGGPEVSGARLYPPLCEPPDKEQASQLEILRRRVMEYWVDGVLKHSLHSEVLISLGKRQMGEAIDAPWKYTVEVSDSTNPTPLDDRDLSALYDATGLLLILGEPGSGKTTTLLELARTLLERARDDVRERVPVVLNLSSWKKKHLRNGSRASFRRSIGYPERSLVFGSSMTISCRS